MEKHKTTVFLLNQSEGSNIFSENQTFFKILSLIESNGSSLRFICSITRCTCDCASSMTTEASVVPPAWRLKPVSYVESSISPHTASHYRTDVDTIITPLMSLSVTSHQRNINILAVTNTNILQNIPNQAIATVFKSVLFFKTVWTTNVKLAYVCVLCLSHKEIHTK